MAATRSVIAGDSGIWFNSSPPPDGLASGWRRSFQVVRRTEEAASVKAEGSRPEWRDPIGSRRELASIRVPTLLVRGDDEQHPAEVSDLYAASITDCTVVPAADPDTVRAIRDFCDGVIVSERGSRSGRLT